MSYAATSDPAHPTVSGPSRSCPATASTNPPRPWLIGIELRDRDPGDILAVPVADHGWAYAGDLSKLYRAWTGDRLGELDTTTLMRASTAPSAQLSTCERPVAKPHDQSLNCLPCTVEQEQQPSLGAGGTFGRLDEAHRFSLGAAPTVAQRSGGGRVPATPRCR